MSQFYDNASLVVVPSGYKAGTVYAQKPLTTDGQLGFTRTGDTATRVNSAGLIEPVLANVPRLDYLGSTCPRLILEGQRTNFSTYSEQLDNAAWTKANCTISANAVTSPDGYQNADNIVTTAANSDIGRLTATITANTATYTQSAFFKWVSGYEFVKYRIALVGGTAQAAYLDFNARTGAFSASDTTYKIESYGNGWFRVSFQITNNGTNTSLITQIYPTNVTTATQTLSAWGFQVEEGAYATSYIPTVAASATRGADACSKTGISSLIGQTEGTLFVEVNFNGTGFGTDNDFLIYAGNGSNTNSMYIDYYNNLFRFVVFTGGSLTFYTDIATTNGTHKLGLAYKSGSYAAYVDGVQIAVDTNAANPPTTSIFSLGGNATGFTAITKNTKQALLFKTRLTNAELAELTTL